MRRPLALAALALGLSAAVAAADPPAVVTVPLPAPAKWVDFKTSPGKLLQLSAGDKPAKWTAASDDFDLVPSESGKLAYFVATKPGTYTLTCSAETGEAARVRVTVGDGPLPPEPPGPKPPAPPKPQDELAKALQLAYDGDPADRAQKSKDLRQLAALYALAAKFAEDAAKVKTAGDLWAAIRGAPEALLDDRLMAVRTVIAGELLKVLPTDEEVALTDAARAAAAATFRRYAEALGKVTP